MSPTNATPQSRIPAVDQLLRTPATEDLIESYGRLLVRDELRRILAALRQRMSDGDSVDADPEAILDLVRQGIENLLSPGLRPVFNLTGTVLHTNLGRAPLPEEAISAMADVARGASNLEYDLAKGRRGDRDDHLENWICRLTGAEAATVVNNNAAAVLLALNALANRRQVPVSRGELVEIGGAFRLPDIMARAGCKLVEVGTTNRTHPADFENAITAGTAALMKAHASNYQVQGFTADVGEAEMARIAHEHGLPLIVDLGAGALVDLTQYGLPHEPTVRETIEAGADLVTFSGDKLLGGPQCGLIVGRADLVKKLKKSPLKRAMRCDKMTIAALAAVLRLYADPERLAQRLPALAILSRPEGDIARQAERLQPQIAKVLGDSFIVSIEPTSSQIGSGAQPVELLPSRALTVAPVKGGGGALKRLSARLRGLPLPVIGRIGDGRLWLDLRTLRETEEDRFIAQLGAD
jgi:L-seryl-tRNA(Ser) seleniumtransferase